MAHTWRLRPKRGTILGFTYIKGWGFHQLKFMKREGNLSEKGRKELTQGYGCEKVDKISWFCDLSERFTIEIFKIL